LVIAGADGNFLAGRDNDKRFFAPPGPVVAHDSSKAAIMKNSITDDLWAEKVTIYNLTECVSKLHTRELWLAQSFVLSARSPMIGSL